MLHMLHMDYIHITYELHTGYIWKLISTVHTYAACNLHTDYIWKHSCIYPAYIQYMSLKKINKSIMNQWSHFWESPYFIANCRFGRGLASQGRSKPPRKMGDASNAATEQPIRKLLEFIPNIAWPAIIELVLWDLSLQRVPETQLLFSIKGMKL